MAATPGRGGGGPRGPTARSPGTPSPPSRGSPGRRAGPIAGWLALVIAAGVVPFAIGQVARSGRHSTSPAAAKPTVSVSAPATATAPPSRSPTAAPSPAAKPTGTAHAAAVHPAAAAPSVTPHPTTSTAAPATPVAAPTPTATGPPAAATAASSPSRAPPAARQLVVTPGQSLWVITAHLLGPHATNTQIAATWPTLYRANASHIGANPNLLAIGTTLVVPTLAA